MKEIKLIKQVELGKYTFNISINRAIFLDINDKFPDFFKKAIEFSKDREDIQESLANGKMRDLLEYQDYINSRLPEIIKFSLPLLLKEADDKTNALEIIDYAIDNNVEMQMNNALMEFIISVFTQGELKKPKVKFSIK